MEAQRGHTRSTFKGTPPAALPHSCGLLRESSCNWATDVPSESTSTSTSSPSPHLAHKSRLNTHTLTVHQAKPSVCPCFICTCVYGQYFYFFPPSLLRQFKLFHLQLANCKRGTPNFSLSQSRLLCLCVLQQPALHPLLILYFGLFTLLPLPFLPGKVCLQIICTRNASIGFKQLS